MQALSRKILEEYQVRKTGKQKAEFRRVLMEGLREMGIEAREEKHKGLFPSVNVVVGDADGAKILFSAHYDTAPRLPVPNLITPRSWPFFLLYQLVISVMMVAAMALAAGLVWWITRDRMAASFAMTAVAVAVLALIYKGPANPHTVNDNTSGVLALIETMALMPESRRAQCAFVFFDNEEVGMVGSSAFRKAHKNCAKNTPLINMDCVGDGETLMLAASKGFRLEEGLYEAFQRGFEGEGPVLHVNAASTVYPSDQTGFKKSVAMAALNRSPVLGWYIGRIHTPRDLILREENLGRIARGLDAVTEKWFGK